MAGIWHGIDSRRASRRVIILFPLDIHTATIQSPCNFRATGVFSVCEGTERGMSFRGEREKNRKHF